MQLIDIPQFIREQVLDRPTSMFRPDIEAHEAALRTAIAGKSLLVIGGAGTIGSSFIKAALEFEPARLFVVDTNENGLTELTRDLRSAQGQYVPADYITYPINFGDEVFYKLLKTEGPFDVVANFAAHKHVRSEKDQYSIEAMLDNNVFKAKRFLDALLDMKPAHFFCVSTDKAANPVNVMGASKKLMEEVIMAYSAHIPITTARFANVAFSNGSLLDGYIQRLLKRQPISCPADIKRFFVSPEESGQICLLACILGQSGEIFFPKLAEEAMVYFKQITEDFFAALGQDIYLAGSEADAKTYAYTRQESDPYPVYFFTTDTSGEKLYEEFYTPTDELDLARFGSLGVIQNASKPSLVEVDETLRGLQQLMQRGSYTKADIVAQLTAIIPDFAHIETGKRLDDKM